MTAPFRHLVCALALIAGLLLAAAAAAQDQAPQEPETVPPETIERLLERLDDPEERERLADELRALLAAQERALPPADRPQPEPRGFGGRLLAGVSEQLESVSEQLSAAGSAVLALPQAVAETLELGREPAVLASWAEIVFKVMVVLAAAFVAERIVVRLLARPRRTLEDRGADSLGLRAFYLLLRTLLDLVPIAAFAGAAYMALPLMQPDFVTRLVALTLVNANVIARIILAAARLVLVPHIPALRLLPMDDEHAAYLYVWMRRVAGVGIYGYFILEAMLLLGLDPAAHALLLRLLGLVITVMAIVLVLQNRGDVADWIRGQRPVGSARPVVEEAPADAPPDTPSQTAPETPPTPPEEERGEEPPEARQRTQALEAERAAKASADSDSTAHIRRRRTLFGRRQAPVPPAIGTLRRRFADVWHAIAIVLISGLYGTWALEVDGGFEFLARAIALTALVVALAALAVRALRKGVDRLFRISNEMKAAFPGLEERANRYLPVLQTVLRVVVYIIAGFAILQAWGLGALAWLFSPTGGMIVGDLVTIFIVIALAFALWEVATAFIERSLAREAANNEAASTRKLTLLPLLRNVVRIALAVVATMVILSHIGIDIGPLLAGAGVVGLAIGFGAQTLVRDVITGAFILMEDAISVGDWIEAGGHAGTVESLTIRTVTLRDLHGTVHVVPFGDVTSITNYNRTYGYALIDVGVAYRENYDEVVEVLQEIAAKLRADETLGKDILGDLEVFGMNALSDSAVEIRVRLMTRPLRQFAIRRAFLERMKKAFDAKGIEIPFPHRTIYFGVDKDGTAPPIRLRQDDESLARPGQPGGARAPALEGQSPQRGDGS